MTVTPEQVLEQLRPVIDPELDISIVDLGLVRSIEVATDTGQVSIGLTLTSPACPLGPEIVAAVRGAAERITGVNAVELTMVWSPPWDARRDASDEARAAMGIWD